jgi:hypothetical protein
MKYIITKTGRLVHDKISELNSTVYLDDISGKQYLKPVEGVLGGDLPDNVLRVSGGEPLLLSGGEEILLGPA